MSTAWPGDWQCLLCRNINFSFRKDCSRCKLISREQNEHNFNRVVYGIPPAFTPLRKKHIVEDAEDDASRLLSLSPVLRQLGL